MDESIKDNQMLLEIKWSHGFKHTQMIQRRHLQQELKRLYGMKPYVESVSHDGKKLEYKDPLMKY